MYIEDTGLNLYDMEHDIREFAIDNNIHHTEVRLTNINYPEELDW